MADRVGKRRAKDEGLVELQHRPMTPYDYEPALRPRRDAPGARWARLVLRVIVIAALLVMIFQIASAVIHV